MTEEKNEKIYCKNCGKDITNLVYKAGESVIASYPQRYKHLDYSQGIIEPYCRECIVQFKI